MPTSEQLLQELVNLKHKELKHQSRDRWIKFFFTTLPKLIFLGFMIYFTWVAIVEIQQFIQEVPNMIQDSIDQKQEDLTSGISESIGDTINLDSLPDLNSLFDKD